jgi:hypothetical protein
VALQLRSPDDVKRLFSAIGGGYGLSDLTLAEVDTLALHKGADLSEIDVPILALSLAVALVTGWVAIRGFDRNHSMSWGLAWAGFGFLYPLPAIALSYYSDVAQA